MIGRGARILQAVAVATYKEWAAYRSHMLLSLFVGPAFFLAQVFIWKAVYAGRETHRGLQPAEHALYFGAASVIQYLVMDFADWNLQMLIQTGQVSHLCPPPHLASILRALAEGRASIAGILLRVHTGLVDLRLRVPYPVDPGAARVGGDLDRPRIPDDVLRELLGRHPRLLADAHRRDAISPSSLPRRPGRCCSFPFPCSPGRSRRSCSSCHSSSSRTCRSVSSSATTRWPASRSTFRRSSASRRRPSAPCGALPGSSSGWGYDDTRRSAHEPPRFDRRLIGQAATAFLLGARRLPRRLHPERAGDPALRGGDAVGDRAHLRDRLLVSRLVPARSAPHPGRSS